MKVLANDGISKSGIKALEKGGFEVITTKVAQEQLVDYINTNSITSLLVRSATQVRKDIIDNCPSLKIIGRGGVGMDNIDVDYAKSKGLQVINTPAASSKSVAELVFSHLFSCVRFLHESNRSMPLDGDSKFKDLKKSLENNSSQENTAINELVENYKHSLLINNYKEQLIKQQLDTIISEAEIDTYYSTNKKNFKLNEELLKIKFLHFNNNLINKKELITLFKSDDLEASEALEKYHLNFKSFQLNDSVWMPLDNIMLKIPFLKEKLLKKTKFIQKQDSLSLYLVAVKDVLKRNDLAPKSYIKSTIKQLILHQRKIELIREIEQIIVKDALQNENFKIY